MQDLLGERCCRSRPVGSVVQVPHRGAPLILRLIEIVVLGYFAARVLHVALKDPVRRDFAAYPALGFGLAGAGVLGLTLAVLAMQRWPQLLHLAALVATMVMVAMWWRARPDYGRSRGWPSGSLGIGASLDAIGDRNFYQDQAKEHGPVFKMSQFGRPVLCILGLARGRELLLRNGDSLASASLPYNQFVPKGSLRYMASTDHDSEAPLFRSALAGLDLTPHEDVARSECRRMLARFSADSMRSDGVIPRPYLRDWVFIVLAGIFLGLDPDDPRLPELDRSQQSLKLDRAGGRQYRKHMEEAFVAVTGLMRQQAAQSPRVDAPTALAAVMAADPDLLTSEARTRNLILIFRLALGDVTSLLDWILTKLTENPEWQETVRAEAQSEGRSHSEGKSTEDAKDASLRVVLETLRMEQSEYLYRRVARPFDFEGFHIPAGWLVRICVQESHRDPEIFADPGTFNPNRFAGRPRSRRQYSPFGADDRGCMGVPMVYFLGRIFVEELCSAYDGCVTFDQPMQKGTRHRDHWRPGAHRRIALTPVA